MLSLPVILRRHGDEGSVDPPEEPILRFAQDDNDAWLREQGRLDAQSDR